MTQDRSKSKPSTNGDARHRPQRILPTERVAVAKQLQILRAFAIASGPSNKPVLVNDVAAIVKMAPSTVSICNAFFKDVGFLVKANESGFLPSPEVVDFNRAYEWNPTTAAHKLSSLIEHSWFGERLLPKARYGSMSVGDAVSDLALAAAAGTDHRPNLEMLIEFMEACGLLTRDNGQVRSGPPSVTNSPAERHASAEAAGHEPREHSLARDGQLAKMATSFTQQEGVVQFHVSVKVNMAEFAGWQSDRIASFFAGIAQVLAAKGEAEEVAGGAQ